MKTLDRRKKILELINKNKRMKIKNIAEILGEKPDGIRRDINILSEFNILEKIHGEITLKNKDSIIEEFYFGEITNRLEKETIVEESLKYINNGDSIYFGSGTTVFLLAKLLKQKNFILNILTNSLPVATILSKNNNFNLIFIGGELHRENYYFLDCSITNLISYFNINKAFLGARGFNIEHGFTISTIEEATLIKSVSNISSEIFIITDKTKFEKSTFIKIPDFRSEFKRKVTKVITNKTPKLEFIKKIESEGIQVILV
jgi:DeoR family transcriptional regulator, fructose operon transcriptional repressor